MSAVFCCILGTIITMTAMWIIPFLGKGLVDISNRIIGFAGGPVLGVFSEGPSPGSRASLFGNPLVVLLIRMFICWAKVSASRFHSRSTRRSASWHRYLRIDWQSAVSRGR